MRLSRVMMSVPSYDPRAQSSSALNARTEFAQSDGYVIEMTGHIVRVTHGTETAVFPLSVVRYAIEAIDASAAKSYEFAKGKRR